MSVTILLWILGFIGAGGVMAVLSIAFGKPKLEFDFCVVPRGDKQILSCEFRNNPARSWFMKLLHIRRPHIEGAIRCEILDRSHKQSSVSTPFVVDTEDVDGKVSKQFSLPASYYLPVKIFVVSYEQATRKALLLDTQADNTLLRAGVLYLVRLTALIEDREIKSKLAGFVITNEIRLLKRLPESMAWGYEI